MINTDTRTPNHTKSWHPWLTYYLDKVLRLRVLPTKDEGPPMYFFNHKLKNVFWEQTYVIVEVCLHTFKLGQSNTPSIQYKAILNVLHR